MNIGVVCFSNLRWLLLSLVITFLDFVTKFWVISHCALGKLIFIFSYVNVCYVYNFGIAFSLLNEFGIKQSGVLLFIMLFIVFILCVLLCCSNVCCTGFLKIAYSIVIGGALGNVIDRMQNSFVIDFIDLHVWDYHFPTFNFADLSIFLGVIMILASNCCKCVKT